MTPPLEAAYAHCIDVARRHYENFPVASFLLPAHMRPHIAAIYAFARTADDFADQPHREPDERVRLLHDYRRTLHRAARGEAGPDLIFVALAETIRRYALPLHLFEDLLSAFEQDVTVHRYDTWDRLLDYCRRSANPVGRLVLKVAAVHDAHAERASDALCTGLQLANFWQDFGRDWHEGRLYVPREEIVRAFADEGDLDRRRMSAQWKIAMRACVERTRTFFSAGREVADAVTGRLRYELRATWLGGKRILDKVEALDYDTLRQRPTLTIGDAAAILPGIILWKNRRNGT